MEQDDNSRWRLTANKHYFWENFISGELVGIDQYQEEDIWGQAAIKRAYQSILEPELEPVKTAGAAVKSCCFNPEDMVFQSLDDQQGVMPTGRSFKLEACYYEEFEGEDMFDLYSNLVVYPINQPQYPLVYMQESWASLAALRDFLLSGDWAHKSRFNSQIMTEMVNYELRQVGLQLADIVDTEAFNRKAARRLSTLGDQRQAAEELADSKNLYHRLTEEVKSFVD